MPSKQQVTKPARPAKVEKKAPQKPQTTQRLANRVVAIGKHVETLIKQRKPVSLVDAQKEILEKLPQMIEGLSSRLEQIGKREVLEKLPQLVHESLSSQVDQKMQEVIKLQESRLANLETVVLEKLDSLPEKLRSDLQKVQAVKRGAEGKELKSEIQSLGEEVRVLKQTLEEMKSSFNQVVSKLSPPSHEEQPKQAEEPKAG